MMETFSFWPQAPLLRRFPLREKEPLRAWDAADEHLLKQLSAEPASPGSRVLIVNDSFGALAVALHALRPQVWSDSFLTAQGLEANLLANGLDPSSVPFVPADQTPSGPFDLVLLKLPKSLSFWQDTLLRLRPLLTKNSRVITGGMIKHSPARAYALLEEILGPTRTGLGWKKSRLALTAFDPDRNLPAALADAVYALDDEGLDLINAPNVFSRLHLDLGTRFLLKHLPRDLGTGRALDLGCGNGVLALVLARHNEQAQVLGVDESYQAVACARKNASIWGGAAAKVEFKVGADLQDCPSAHFDLVVCNPPFHQAQVVGDQIAWGMFQQARRVIRPGGRLLIVANRHLGYHVKLKRLFGNGSVVAAEKKFVVLSASVPGSHIVLNM